MAHPMAGQAKASEKRRLGYLSAKPGKAWGSSKMYKKASYPKKHAGSSTPMTISGGKGKKRPDRFAFGGGVKSKKHKPHHTTNIVIAAPGGAGGRGTGGGGGGTRPHPVPVPLPVRPPMAPPMAGAAPPVAAPMGGGLGAPAVLPRPPMGPMAGGLPPRPLGAGMPGMKSGGVVKKRIGGDVGGGRAYRGFPHSPTTDVEDAVSAHKKGGKVGKIEGKLSGLGTREPYAAGGRVGKRANGGPTNKKNDDDSDADGSAAEELAAGIGSADASPPAADVAPPPSTQRRGGAVKRRQGGGTLPYGGLIGPRPGIQTGMPVQRGAPTISGRAAIPAQRQMIPAPNTLASQRLRPAPGTTVGFKRGGKAGHQAKHDDEAQDKKLIAKMLKQEEKQEKKREKA